MLGIFFIKFYFLILNIILYKVVWDFKIGNYFIMKFEFSENTIKEI